MTSLRSVSLFLSRKFFTCKTTKYFVACLHTMLSTTHIWWNPPPEWGTMTFLTYLTAFVFQIKKKKLPEQQQVADLRCTSHVPHNDERRTREQKVWASGTTCFPREWSGTFPERTGPYPKRHIQNRVCTSYHFLLWLGRTRSFVSQNNLANLVHCTKSAHTTLHTDTVPGTLGKLLSSSRMWMIPFGFLAIRSMVGWLSWNWIMVQSMRSREYSACSSLNTCLLK